MSLMSGMRTFSWCRFSRAWKKLRRGSQTVSLHDSPGQDREDLQFIAAHPSPTCLALFHELVPFLLPHTFTLRDPAPALAFASSPALPTSQHCRQVVPLQKHRLGLRQQKPSGLGIKEINCPEQCTSCTAQGVA